MSNKPRTKKQNENTSIPGEHMNQKSVIIKTKSPTALPLKQVTNKRSHSEIGPFSSSALFDNSAKSNDISIYDDIDYDFINENFKSDQSPSRKKPVKRRHSNQQAQYLDSSKQIYYLKHPAKKKVDCL